MSLLRLDIDERQAVLHSEGAVCASTQELVESAAFARVVGPLRRPSGGPQSARRWTSSGLRDRDQLLDLLRLLANNPIERVAGPWCGPGDLIAQPRPPARVRRRPLRLLAALGPLPRGARRHAAAARRQAPVARLQPGGRVAGAPRARPVPRRRGEHHGRPAARVPPGRRRRRGGRVRGAAQVAGPGSLPRAAGRHPLRAAAAHVPAAAAGSAHQHPHRRLQRGRAEPAGRPDARARAVAVLPGARGPSRGLRLLPPALRRAWA